MYPNPTISILVANCNNGPFFKDCYDSLIQQTYQDVEVIIMDDCSTDDSVQTIQSTVGNDARVQIFRNEQNGGVGFTKKRCIDLAKGALCAFVNFMQKYCKYDSRHYGNYILNFIISQRLICSKYTTFCNA